jgi:nuclear GTP-binding protein
MSRIDANRKWFGNTRVIGQKELETFRDAMSEMKKDPYQFVVRQNKLPMSLLSDPIASKHSHLLMSETFENTFGKKSHRKKPKLSVGEYAELFKEAEEKEEKYDEVKDKDLVNLGEVNYRGKNINERTEVRAHSFTKGNSKRLWGELYKVIDAADVVIQVLDARDPNGTRSKHIEDYMRKEKPYKQLVFVLNKCDLVPNWATAGWVAELSKVTPTLAFHASLTNSYGKGALIQLLRQFGQLHQDKQQISVGFIGCVTAVISGIPYLKLNLNLGHSHR